MNVWSVSKVRQLMTGLSATASDADRVDQAAADIAGKWQCGWRTARVDLYNVEVVKALLEIESA